MTLPNVGYILGCKSIWRSFLLNAMAIMVAIMPLDLVASNCVSSNYCCDSSSTYTVPAGKETNFICCIQPADGTTAIFTSSDCPSGSTAQGEGSSIQCCTFPSYSPSTVSSCSESTCDSSYWKLCGCEDGTECSISGYETKLIAGCNLQDSSGSTFACPIGWESQSNPSYGYQCVDYEDYEYSPPPTPVPTYAPGAPTPAPTRAPTPTPTEFPTSAGQSTSEAITFGVSQSLSGLSKTVWDSNEADNLAVFKAATARLLDCTESDIDNVVVADSSRRRLALSNKVQDVRALSTSSIAITYDVILQVASGESSSDVYSTAVNVIVDSTASGCSTNCLATIISEVAEAKGVSSADIVSATVTPVSSDDIGSAMTITIPAPTATPTSAPNKDDTWMTTEVIAGMAAVVIVIAVVCCVGACILGLSRKKDVKLDDHAQENQPFVEGGTTEAKKVAPVEVAPVEEGSPAEEVYEI